MKNIPIFIIFFLVIIGLIFVSSVGNKESRMQRSIKYLSSISIIVTASIIILITTSPFFRSNFLQILLFSTYSTILASVASSYFSKYSSYFIISALSCMLALFFLPMIEGTDGYSLVNFPDEIAWGDMYRISVLLTLGSFAIVVLSVSFGFIISQKFKKNKISNVLENSVTLNTKPYLQLLLSLGVVLVLFSQNFDGYSLYGAWYHEGTVTFWFVILVTSFYIWRISIKEEGFNKLLWFGISVLPIAIVIFNILHTSYNRFFFWHNGWVVIILISLIWYIYYVRVHA